MTDNEIIKALDCCANCESCDFETTNCPLVEEMECRSLLAQKALDLITRQRTEIERLKEEKSKLENKIDEMYPLVMQLPNAMQQAKSEAYKEFADLSIKRICEQVSAPTPSKSYIVERCNQEIYNLLKEMAGEG